MTIRIIVVNPQDEVFKSGVTVYAPAFNRLIEVRKHRKVFKQLVGTEIGGITHRIPDSSA